MNQTTEIESFLKNVEREALMMAEFAVKDRDEAFDIVQDVMFAFVKRYSNKPIDQWRPLFFRCINNRIKDWYRKQKVRSRWMIWQRPDPENQFDLVETAADNGPSPLSSVSDGEFGQSLASALQQLPHRQRQAFLLRSWQGFSVAEAAQAMGCGEGSVKTHLSRAMSALRHQLAEFIS